ncbi:hypothetical protein OG250_16465 [Streptomyces sp. NBC_00487]|uniref:hypothetical protein n=1 Tax=unclassified Streptomyces TaxID=2593676 RepID=UPI002E193F4B|nr:MULTISPECIES: hypothetical protein [unclassified Streptomyces]
MRVPECELPGVPSLVCENGRIVCLGTYATALFMIYFPLGVVAPAPRPWAAAMSIGFHVSLAVFMGLTGFAPTRVACALVFLSSFLDRALSAAHALRVRVADRPHTRRTGTGPSDGRVPQASEAEGVSR